MPLLGGKNEKSPHAPCPLTLFPMPLASIAIHNGTDSQIRGAEHGKSESAKLP
jgi:hypothetical protein